VKIYHWHGRLTALVSGLLALWLLFQAL